MMRVTAEQACLGWMVAMAALSITSGCHRAENAAPEEWVEREDDGNIGSDSHIDSDAEHTSDTPSDTDTEPDNASDLDLDSTSESGSLLEASSDFGTDVAAVCLMDTDSDAERDASVFEADGGLSADSCSSYPGCTDWVIGVAARAVNCEVAICATDRWGLGYGLMDIDWSGVEFFLNGRPIDRDPGCAAGTGWDFAVSGVYDTIVLCPEACMKTMGQVPINLSFELECNCGVTPI